MGRREELTRLATDHVLEHGLLRLSLRPLAAAIGTSDRMLLYHFADKDDLVASVLRDSTSRSVVSLRRLPTSGGPERAVLDLWAAVSTPEQSRCQRLYVEAAALGVLGAEPYAAVVAVANREWLQALGDHLVASGLPVRHGPAAARLVEATFMGLQLDEAVEPADAVRASVADLAAAVAGLWAAGA